MIETHQVVLLPMVKPYARMKIVDYLNPQRRGFTSADVSDTHGGVLEAEGAASSSAEGAASSSAEGVMDPSSVWVPHAGQLLRGKVAELTELTEGQASGDVQPAREEQRERIQTGIVEVRKIVESTSTAMEARSHTDEVLGSSNSCDTAGVQSGDTGSTMFRDTSVARDSGRELLALRESVHVDDDMKSQQNTGRGVEPILPELPTTDLRDQPASDLSELTGSRRTRSRGVWTPGVYR